MRAETNPAMAAGRGLRRPLVLMALAAIVALIGIGLVLGPATGTSPSTDDSTGSDSGTVDGTADPDGTGDPDGTADPDGQDRGPAPTATVTRGDLVQAEDETGQVGYGVSWTLPIRAEGVITDAPDKGSIVEPGQELVRLGDKPVHLAQGEVPLYRELRYESSAKRRLEGDDVSQLQRFLLDAGFDDSGRLEVDGEFGRSTERAVKAWQKEHGLEQSGRVDRTQLVFRPGPVRIAEDLRVGDDFSQLTVTEATQTVTADFDRDHRNFVPVGAEVALDPGGDDGTVTGVVTDVESTIDDSGDQKLRITITPDRPLPVGVERLTVEASREAATDVLIAPVRAVLALAGGGYALEVDTGSGTELRRIELGAVVDDLVEVTGDVAEGDDVVVPRQIGGES